jgi:hypothetical protein
MDDVSVVPCAEVARKLAEARKTLLNSVSKTGRESAAMEYQILRKRVAEMRLFTEGCFEPGENAKPEIDFHRDLYGRNRM